MNANIMNMQIFYLNKYDLKVIEPILIKHSVIANIMEAQNFIKQ